MHLSDLRRQLRALGARPCHEYRVLRLWSNALPQASGKRRPEDFLPLAVRAGLPAFEAGLDALARLRSEHPAGDGSARLLVDLGDGQTIESVLLPDGGLCVSTQVGCAVGCVFCMTGQGGLVRQLGSAEIVAQVALARRLRPVRKVVFMGMGEPAHNLDAVLEAIELLGTEGNLAHKSLVFSTVGDRRAFDRLAGGRVKPALAISLHSTRPELRARLLPRAPRLTPEELVEFGERHARATGHPVQYQWTLLDGVNDGADECEGIVRLLQGRRAMLNLIPYNRIEGAGIERAGIDGVALGGPGFDGRAFARPPVARSEALAAALRRRGVLTTLRQSAGQDVDAGCGQLRVRAGRTQPISLVAQRRGGVTDADVHADSTTVGHEFPQRAFSADDALGMAAA